VVKKANAILIIVFLLLFVATIRLLASSNDSIRINDFNNHSYIENNLLSSSRYTTKEVKDEVKYQNFLDNYTLQYTEEELLFKNYKKYGETDQLILYFHPTSFSILIHNKITNYQWSSRAEFIEENEANRSRLNEMESGIWVEYVLSNNISRKTSVTNVMEERATITHRPVKDTGFKATVNFMKLGFKFDVEVSIESSQLTVKIDDESIEETLPRYTLVGLQLFPYLGSARQDKFPGYMFIPDGVGALVRFEENSNTFYQDRYYGDDYGYSKTTVNRRSLSVPVFGVVHDVDENGFIGIIESGDTMARLGAYFWGYEGGNYYRMAPRYYYRELYTNVIDKTGAGKETVDLNIKPIDIIVHYDFLSENEANYVGMANTYKSYLEENQGLSKQTNLDNDIPLSIDFIMSELEPTFIGNRIVRMTSPKAALDIYKSFKDENINNQTLNILGWSVSGIFDTAPYKIRYSDSKSNYKDLISEIENDDNDIYFQVDYVGSSNNAKRITSSDVARQMSKLKMEIKTSDYFSDTSTSYLYPDASLRIINSDYSDFNNLSINKLSFRSLGNTLFSYYEKGIRYNRDDSLSYYNQILEQYGNSGFYNPNAYMYQYTNDYFNMPIYNSGHNYFTDLVPFLPYVLKGNIDYYSPYLNFNSLGTDQILNLIDFGVNPSYIITEKDTTLLRYTLANHFYSTSIADYSSAIIRDYHYINDALSHVYGHSVVSREVIETGIVAIKYSNNKIIYVNYSSNDYSIDDVIIKAKDYKVI